VQQLREEELHHLRGSLEEELKRPPDALRGKK